MHALLLIYRFVSFCSVCSGARRRVSGFRLHGLKSRILRTVSRLLGIPALLAWGRGLDGREGKV